MQNLLFRSFCKYQNSHIVRIICPVLAVLRHLSPTSLYLLSPKAARLGKQAKFREVRMWVMWRTGELMGLERRGKLGRKGGRGRGTGRRKGDV
jgi:hypothetical protein